VFSFLFGSKLVRQVPGETGGLQGSWSPEIVPPCADLLMEVCYASSGQPRGGASCPPRRRSPLPLRRSPSSRRPALPRHDPFPASTLSAPPRSLYTVFTITRQRYGSRVAFTTGNWSARLGGTRGRRSASPETVTGPTEAPASCRSVAGVSFANSGFVARTRSGVFGQAMSRHASRTLRRGL
jgi:hypothetical protein